MAAEAGRGWGPPRAVLRAWLPPVTTAFPGGARIQSPLKSVDFLDAYPALLDQKFTVTSLQDCLDDSGKCPPRPPRGSQRAPCAGGAVAAGGSGWRGPRTSACAPLAGRCAHPASRCGDASRVLTPRARREPTVLRVRWAHCPTRALVTGCRAGLGPRPSPACDGAALTRFRCAWASSMQPSGAQR